MDKPKPVMVLLHVLSQPVDDRPGNFNAGIRRKWQIAIDQGLSETNSASHIEKIESAEIGATNSSSEPP
jgi:hypothetical protein